MGTADATVIDAIDMTVASLTYRWKIHLEWFDSGADNIPLLDLASRYPN